MAGRVDPQPAPKAEKTKPAQKTRWVGRDVRYKDYTDGTSGCQQSARQDQETKASERGVLLMPIIHGLAAQRYGLYYPFAQFGTQSVSASDTLRVLNRTRLFPKANVQK